MKKKAKGRTAMLRVAFYGGAPVNGMAARVAGVKPAASRIQDLRHQAKNARTVKQKESLMTQARAIEHRMDSRLISSAAMERARKAMERSKWSSDQKDIERTKFKR